MISLGLATVLAAASVAVPPPQEGTPLLAVRGVTAVDARGAREGVDVLVRGARIERVAPAGSLPVPDGAVVVDGAGKFLVPGLWDLHLHLTIVDEQATSERLLPLLVRYGVTSVRDMGGDLARLGPLKESVRNGAVGPRILTPGPFLDGPQPASPNVSVVEDAASARAAIAKLKAAGVDFLKVQAGLSPTAYRAVMAEAARAKLPVVGHVPEAVSAFDVAASGQRSIEHSSAILPGDAGVLLACSAREEELRAELLALGKAWQEKDADRAALRKRQRTLQTAMLDSVDPAKRDRLFALLVKRRVAWVPTLVWGRGVAPLSATDTGADLPLSLVPPDLRARWEKRRAEVIAASGDEDFAFRTRLSAAARDLVKAAHAAGVTLLAGTDSIDAFVVPGYSLHQELELLVEAGLSPAQALEAATEGAARLLGVKDAGTIERGRRADLVLLSASPLTDIRNTRRIEGVVLAGRWLPVDALERAASGAGAQPSAAASSAAGTTHVTTVPPPSLALRLSLPPWAARISAASGRPRPEPPSLRE